MSNQLKFIEELIKYINTFTTCYYEQAPTSGTFPYSVLIPPNTTSLDSGNLTMLDIEIYASEQVGTEQVEALCDLIKNKLDNYLLNSANNFSCHINFEGYYNMRENEQDLMARRLTFSARVFYL